VAPFLSLRSLHQPYKYRNTIAEMLGTPNSEPAVTAENPSATWK
jgi:hypothetical protein